MDKKKKVDTKKAKKQKTSCCRDSKLVDVVNKLAESGYENLAKRIVKSILK